MNEYIHKYLTIKEKKGMESNKRIIVSGGGVASLDPICAKDSFRQEMM